MRRTTLKRRSQGRQPLTRLTIITVTECIMADSNGIKFYPDFVRLLAECEAVLSATVFNEQRCTSALENLVLLDPTVCEDNYYSLPLADGVSRIPRGIQGKASQEIIGTARAYYERLYDRWDECMDAQDAENEAWAAARLSIARIQNTPAN